MYSNVYSNTPPQHIQAVVSTVSIGDSMRINKPHWQFAIECSPVVFRFHGMYFPHRYPIQIVNIYIYLSIVIVYGHLNRHVPSVGLTDIIFKEDMHSV